MNWSHFYQSSFEMFLLDNITTIIAGAFILACLIGSAGFAAGRIWTNQRKQRYDFEELKTENKKEHEEIADEMKEVKDDLADAKAERAEIKSDVKLIKHVVLNGRDEREVAKLYWYGSTK